MLAGFGVPQKRAPILTRGSKHGSVGSEIERLDAGSVSVERAQLAARGHVPNLDRVVSSGGSEQFAVTTECDFADAAAVTLDRAGHRAGGQVPKLHLALCFNFQIFHQV